MSKKILGLGIILTLSFFTLLAAMAMPIWEGKTFLAFADDTFNGLSKGSSNFIPEVREESEVYVGKSFDAVITMDSPEQAERSALLYQRAGADVKVDGNRLEIYGDLGTVFLNSLDDSEALFHNNDQALEAKYGYDGKEVVYNWWMSLAKLSKYFEAQREFETSLHISHELLTRGVEPSYNYFGVEAMSVGDFFMLLGGFLGFYIIYTVLWGFAIYFNFEGIGLRMEKSKKKEEV